jgi:hypothetical protein
MAFFLIQISNSLTYSSQIRHPRMSAFALTREVRALARLEGCAAHLWPIHPSRLAEEAHTSG